MGRNKERSTKRKLPVRGGEKGTVKRVAIVSEGGDERESRLPQEGTNTMADVEAVLEMGRVMMEGINRQIEVQLGMQREFQREREEQTMQRFADLIEGQSRHHKEDTEVLTSEFEKMRIEKEQARGRQTQRLPTYDGLSLDVDEWQDKVEIVIKCNKWDLGQLLEALPVSLSGQARRSFDSLTDEDKLSKEGLFQSMRIKIDPRSEKRNKELFVMAKKGGQESVTSFIDRCRQYIRRSGGDATEPFAKMMLRFKVYDCLSTTDRKILEATVDEDEDLDKIIIKANSLVTAQQAIIGNVQDERQQNREPPTNGEESGYQQNQGSRGIICHRCGNSGHIRRYCPRRENIQGSDDQGEGGLMYQECPQGLWGPYSNGSNFNQQGNFYCNLSEGVPRGQFVQNEENRGQKVNMHRVKSEIQGTNQEEMEYNGTNSSD